MTSLHEKKAMLYNEYTAERTGSWGAKAENIKKYLHGMRVMRLLDIGCGDGEFTLTFRDTAQELWGVDISQSAVERSVERGIRATLLDTDESPLPYEDNFFDMVVCAEVLAHVFDSDHIFEEMHRVLKPGGIAIITTPNLANYLNRFVLPLGYQPYLTGTGFKYGAGKLFSKSPCPHLRVFTYHALKELFPLFGFRVCASWGERYPNAHPPFSWVDAIFSRVPSLATQLVFIVEKDK